MAALLGLKVYFLSIKGYIEKSITESSVKIKESYIF